MKNNNIEDLKENFQLYLFSMDDSLSDLENMLNSHFETSEKILNESPESLDLIELFLAKVIDGKIEIDIPLDMLMTRVSTYMGEILRKKRKGRWRICTEKNNYDFGYPQIERISGLDEKFGWCPLQVVYNFKANRKKGVLRSATFGMIEFDIDKFSAKI